MTRHILKLIWNRKRTNLLMMAEIFVSFLVLFAVVGLGVYTADNWRRPRGFSIENVWDVSIDMKQTTDDTFNETQQADGDPAAAGAEEHAGDRHVGRHDAGARTRWGRRTAATAGEAGRWTSASQRSPTASRTSWASQVVEGRWFGREDDGLSYQPVVINEDMRRELFDDGPAIGQVLNPEHRPEETDYREQRVVGVVAAYREDGEFDGSGRTRSTVDRDPATGRCAIILVKVQPGTTGRVPGDS